MSQPKLCAACHEQEPTDDSIMCKPCRTLADDLIGNMSSAVSDVVVVVNHDNSWSVGKMRLNPQRGTR